MNSIGDRIKNLRLKNNMTLEEFGEKIGVGKSTVRKWETGMIQNMKRDKIAKIATVLNVSPSYLLGWDQEQIDAISEIQSDSNQYYDEMESGILSFTEEFAEAHLTPAEIFQLKMFMRSMKNNPEVKIDLGKAIRESRESKGMTKEELAKMLEVPVEMIDLYEGSMSFPYEQMKKLNSILGISFYTMLGIPQEDASLYEKIYFLHLTEDEMKEVYEYAKYIQSKKK